MAEEVTSPHGAFAGDPRPSRAHFWRRLSDILAEKHATGEVQSKARFIANEMRLRSAATRGRERVLLWFYKKIRYGELIGAPLAWFLAASFVFTIALNVGCSDRSAWPYCEGIYADEALSHRLTVWQGLVAVLLSPLSFFRFAQVPHVQTLSASFSLIVIQILGVVMIYFTLAAIRRVTRAE